MPSKLCETGIVVQSILSTKKLSMNKHGDIKAQFEQILNGFSFSRDEETVHTYDDGWYFYQCSEWVHEQGRITLHAIGINEEHIGWWFWVVLSSSPCDAQKNIGNLFRSLERGVEC